MIHHRTSLLYYGSINAAGTSEYDTCMPPHLIWSHPQVADERVIILRVNEIG